MRTQLSLTKNRCKTRTRRIGGIEFRTVDRKVDLDERWTFREETLEVCNYMRVPIVWLRSDNFRCYAAKEHILVRPPKTQETLLTIAHESAHMGFRHSRRMSRHRMEFETGTFEIAFIKHCGLTPTPRRQNRGRMYVAWIIDMAIRRKVTVFDRQAWMYSALPDLPLEWVATRNSIESTLNDQSRKNGYAEAMATFCL